MKKSFRYFRYLFVVLICVSLFAETCMPVFGDDPDSNVWGLQTENTLMAADYTTKSITSEFTKYLFDKDCLLFKPGSTATYYFVYSGLSNLSIKGNNEGDAELSKQEFPGGDNSLLGADSSLIVAKLKAGIEYDITAQVTGNACLYFYKAPACCVKLEKKPSASGDNPSDYLRVIRYKDNNGNPVSLSSEVNSPIGVDQKGSYYFITKAVSSTANSMGTEFCDIFNSPFGHVWNTAKVITTATCVRTGLKRCTCLCGECLDQSIPKTAHKWSAFNRNGDRSCSICGAKQHDESKVIITYAISGRPVILKPVATGGRKLKVKWKKPSKSKLKKIKGYYIEVATDKNFTHIVKKKRVKKSKTFFTFTKLRKEQKYFVRIRFYNGSRISRWSAIKKMKVK